MMEGSVTVDAAIALKFSTALMEAMDATAEKLEAAGHVISATDALFALTMMQAYLLAGVKNLENREFLQEFVGQALNEQISRQLVAGEVAIMMDGKEARN